MTLTLSLRRRAPSIGGKCGSSVVPMLLPLALCRSSRLSTVVTPLSVATTERPSTRFWAIGWERRPISGARCPDPRYRGSHVVANGTDTRGEHRLRRHRRSPLVARPTPSRSPMRTAARSAGLAVSLSRLGGRFRRLEGRPAGRFDADRNPIPQGDATTRPRLGASANHAFCDRDGLVQSSNTNEAMIRSRTAFASS